jgi:hypothetical protein
MSDSSSTPVAVGSGAEITSDDEEKYPCYVLGQKVPDFRARPEKQVEHDDLAYGSKFQAYVVSVVKTDGKTRNYVGLVGELHMHDANTVETAYMIIGPRKVVSVTPDKIFNIDCDLAYPAGYGRVANPRTGKVRFSISKIMEAYWNTEA